MSTVPVSRSLPNVGLDAAFDGRASQDQSLRGLERVEPNAQLLVLSRNPNVVTVVRNASRTVAQVFHARDLDDAARSMPDLVPGVLLLDGAIASNVSASIAQLTRRFPEAVLVIVGTREESSELMQLAAAGRIFRFLLMPLSFGPARLALAAAASHHIERKAVTRRIAATPEEPTPSAGKHLFAYLTLAAVLLVLMGGLWRISGSLAAKPAPAVAKVAPVVSGAPSPLLAQLARAADEMKQGHWIEPADSSALALYRGVLHTDPNNVAARHGIRAIADEFLQQAEQALLAARFDEVERLLTLVQVVEPEHPRLAFLDSRLAREQEWLNLSERRQVSNKVRQLVSASRGDLLAGNLIGTGTGGALGSLLAARKLDPDDIAVVQATRELSLALADAVRLALNAGDEPRAQAFGAGARKLGAGEQLLAAIDRSVRDPTKDAKRNPTPVAPAQASPAPNIPVPERIEEVIASVGTAESATAASGSGEVLQAAGLPRVKAVFPSYPKTAAAAGIEGYVDLEFTIATDGVPRNLLVLGGTPRRVFDNAAMNCVRQWRFEPIQQDGLPVARRAALRVRFQLR